MVAVPETQDISVVSELRQCLRLIRALEHVSSDYQEVLSNAHNFGRAINSASEWVSYLRWDWMQVLADDSWVDPNDERLVQIRMKEERARQFLDEALEGLSQIYAMSILMEETIRRDGKYDDAA